MVMMKTIKSRKEFEKVFARGKRLNDPLLRIRVLRDDEGGLDKVAFVAPKRLGNAVFRNRCKRVLRESARECGLPRAGFDVILFATSQTHDATPHEVSKALERLLARAGI